MHSGVIHSEIPDFDLTDPQLARLKAKLLEIVAAVDRPTRSHRTLKSKLNEAELILRSSGFSDNPM